MNEERGKLSTMTTFFFLILIYFLVNTVKLALFKSLSIIMGIQIGGWLFSLTAYNLLDKGIFNNLSNDQQIMISFAINFLSSITSTCEVPAIFITRSFMSLIVTNCECLRVSL